jgi:phytoene desaturase
VARTADGRRVVVVGGGFGGLGAAALLARDGFDVTLLEKNEQLGGRAGLLEDRGFAWDMGPSWYLMPDVFRDFFALLGERVEDHLELTRLSPSYRIYFEDGDVVDLTGDLEADARTFDRYEPGAGEKLREYLRLSEYQYDIAMRDFVPNNYDSFRDFLTPTVMTQGPKLHVFETMERYVERFFTHPKLRKIIQYTLVFLGSSPYSTPALYNIMSHVDFNLGVWYPQGGIYEVIHSLERIALRHGARLRCNAPVERILVGNGKVVGVRVGREVIPADLVVSNADLHHTETQLLEPRHRTYDAGYWERRTLAPSAFIMYLGLRGRTPGLAHHTLYFCEDWKANFAQIFDDPAYPENPSLYVCCPSRTDPATAPPDHENIFVLVPIAPGLPDTEAQRKRYGAHILELMEQKMCVPDLRERIVARHVFSLSDFAERYNSYRGSALGLAHTMRQSAVMRPNNVSKKVQGLYHVGASTNPGIGMPMCLISAQLARKRILYGK